MIDLIFRVTLSNTFISLVMAGVAVVAAATLRRPGLTHLLWMLVFVKLLTPPVVVLPLVPNWQIDMRAAAGIVQSLPPDAAATLAKGSETRANFSAAGRAFDRPHVGMDKVAEDEVSCIMNRIRSTCRLADSPGNHTSTGTRPGIQAARQPPFCLDVKPATATYASADGL